jgi:eukaryotic-like serine/threonine-protein kinase
MSDPIGPRDDLPERLPAEPSVDRDRGVVPKQVRCRPAAGPGTGFTDELAHLLRTRLRLAILVMLVGFALHFLRNAFRLAPTYDHRPLWLFFGGCEMAVMAGASGLLWSRRPLSLDNLRRLELVLFGSIAAFFAWLQVDTYHDGALWRALVPGHEALVLRLVGLSATLRWFVLIVLYGAFIPNTGRRCAAVVGSLALLPVTLMVADSQLDKATAPYLLSALPETVILMATGVAVAVFGSHKIRELQEKAHEARRIGHYQLKQVLGFGGMGAVYLAEHVLLRRPCAIKLIRPDQAGDPKTLIRFEREVCAAATLTHWNTIEIFDYGHAEDGTFYYVMEYLPGMNLEDLVERHGALPPERAVHLLRQVCQALREAHAVGLIHRDVKPSNIFACERGKVYDVAKLLDFGLVKTLRTDGDSVKLTREGTFAGSPAFMSPEQAQGRRELDARSDIYNVGAVAYFLTTGQLPFDRLSVVEMLHAHAHEPIVPSREFHEGVPADLQGVILRCLEKDPDRRYQDAATLEKALAACAGPSPWSAERAEEWWRRHGDGTAWPSSPEAGNQEGQITLDS